MPADDRDRDALALLEDRREQVRRLDRLAAGGLRFSQFYNTARCWPSRASILTGYYPQAVGRDLIPGVGGGGGSRGKRPAWAALLPHFLRPQGYRSYHSGKWHVDGRLVSPSCNPVSVGIELENLNNGRDPYPDAQYQATVWLTKQLVAKYNIPRSQVVRHLDISPGRKTDPRGSRVAARSVRANLQRRQILEHLERQDATADDLAVTIGRHRSHASTRLTVLGKLGHARKIGTSPRRGDNGCLRDVDLWRITADGRAWLAEVRRMEAA